MSRYVKEVNMCLLRIQAGDESAMTSLYNITANHLKAMIKGYLKNKLFLDDVLLETYERVFLYINSFNPKLDGYNWMCSIAKNLAYAYNNEEIPTVDIDLLKGEVVPDDWLEALETQMNLSLVMKYFDDIDKKVLYLRHYTQESLSEIAKKIGVSKTAVHKRLKNIYKIIRENYS